MKKFLAAYFHFPKKERLGVVVLLLLMFCIWAIPFLFPSPVLLPDTNGLKNSSSQFPANGQLQLNAQSPSNGQASFNALLQQNTQFQQNRQITSSGQASLNAQLSFNEANFLTNATALGNAAKTIHFFYFNPNTISQEDWEQFGMPSKTSKVIQNYLSKGGKFYQPTDLYKIWGISPQLVKTLIPYMRIPPRKTYRIRQTNDDQQQGFTKHPFNAPKKPITGNSFKKQLPNGLFGINSATETDWKKLPGIGEVLSKRIVRFRNSLGGFRSVDQLAKTYGISDSLFEQLKPFLVMDSFPIQVIHQQPAKNN